MNPAPSVSIGKAMTRSSAKSNPARLLYAAFALLILVITFVGFQLFYLHGKAYPGRDIPALALPLVATHGVLMSSWIVLFLVQPLLIVSANRQRHMALGKIGAVLAVAVVVVGLIVPVMVTRHGPEFPLWGLNRRQFMAIPMISILVFGAFVTVGVWFRRRPDIHRPMMLLATLSILGAATDRIGAVHDLYADSFWGRVFGPFFPSLLIGAAFLAIKWLLTRSSDRWYAAGFAVLVAICAMIMQLATTGIWFRFASFLAG
jgi:hypothetical protein